MRELLLGCGPVKVRQLGLGGMTEWDDLTTLDVDPDVHPDVVWDLNVDPFPFPFDTFDELHAYNVLEHCGSLGDWRFFFDQFAEFWRILKPGGHFFGLVPALHSRWLFGDPGHRRVITSDMLQFLDRDFYALKEDGTPKNMQSIGYLKAWRGDFTIAHLETKDDTLVFVLKAKK